MSDSSCRAPSLAALSSLCFALALQLQPHLAAAQDDEVIADPELMDDSSGAGDSDGDLTIEDPELAGTGGSSDGAQGSPGPLRTSEGGDSDYDPTANTGLARIEILGQFGADLHHENDLEDAYETRLRFDAEIDFRRSRRLRLSVGLRTDLFWAMPSRGDPALPPLYADQPDGPRSRAIDQDRFELDLLPLSAYVDTSLGAGFHLRIGEQVVTMARMDFYSPIDILAVADLRGQPRLDVASTKLAQPAIRVDWDLGSWATLQAVYVPWFMPNLSRPNRDLYVATRLGAGGAAGVPNSGAGQDPNLGRSPYPENLIDPSFQTYVSESVFRFVGPAPDFTTPQAQGRLSLRGQGRELGITAGTALEKVPSIYLTPIGERIARGNVTVEDLGIAAQMPIFDTEYHRFYLVGLDGNVDISPITIGFELAYSPERHLYAATFDGSRLPQPNVTEELVDPRIDANDAADEGDDVQRPGNVRDRSIRKGTPLIQGAVHLEWLNGETFALALEAFWVNALRLPYDQSRDWIGFMRGKGAYVGGMLGLMYMLNDGQWRLQSSLVGLLGPSLIWMPQIEFRVSESFYLNIGGQIYEGPKPPPGGVQGLSVGGLLSGYDQAFLGFRYVP